MRTTSTTIKNLSRKGADWLVAECVRITDAMRPNAGFVGVTVVARIDGSEPISFTAQVTREGSVVADSCDVDISDSTQEALAVVLTMLREQAKEQ
jgi:hypothetical protein